MLGPRPRTVARLSAQRADGAETPERMTSIKQERARFPQPAIWIVLLVCALPPLLNVCGVDFGTVSEPRVSDESIDELPVDETALAYRAMRGPFIYTLLEWTAFCIALVTLSSRLRTTF